MEQVLTVEQAAAKTGKSTSYIRRLCRDGVIVCQKVGAGQHAIYLIAPADIDAWAAVERHAGRPRNDRGTVEQVLRDKALERADLEARHAIDPKGVDHGLPRRPVDHTPSP